MTRRHVALLGGGAVLVVLAWFALLWSPKGADLAEARDRRSAAEQDVTLLRARLAHLRAAKDDEPALRSRAEQLAAAVPEHADLASFLLDANAASARAGVAYLSITPSKPVPSTTGGPSEVTFGLEVRGDYAKVLDFMDALLDLPRVVVVDTVGLAADQSVTGPPPLSVSLTGRIFTTEAPATAAATAAPAASPAATPTPSAPVTAPANPMLP